MWFYLVFTWLSYAVQFAFATLSLAAGLYYLAELVEEFSIVAARIIKYIILITIFFYVCLWLFEGFSSLMVGLGVVAQLLHLTLLRNFPVFFPASPSFIGTVVLLIVNHYLAFQFFAQEYRPFGDVLAYMTLCLWLVPFAFLVSLSANDQTLPLISHARTDSSKYGMASFLAPTSARDLLKLGDHSTSLTASDRPAETSAADCQQNAHVTQRKGDNDVVSTYFSKQRRGGFGLLSLFKRAKESLLPVNVQQTKRYA